MGVTSRTMRFSLFGQGEGVRCQGLGPYWACILNGRVTDASVSARRQGVRPGIAAKAAIAMLPQLVLVPEPEEASRTMQAVWETLWKFTPWLETVGKSAFLLQLPGNAPPLQEVRNLLLDVEKVLSPEQRWRTGFAESPFLAQTLVEWSRLERVPGARYFKVHEQELIVSPYLAKWLTQKANPSRNLTNLTTQHWIKNCPIEAVHSASEPMRAKLPGLGVHRVRDLDEISDASLIRHFGKDALHLRRVLEPSLGGSIHVNYPRPEKKVRWQGEPGDCVSLEQLPQLLESLMIPLVKELERGAVGALKVMLKWKTEQEQGEFIRTAKRPVCQLDFLLAQLLPGLKNWRGNKVYDLEVCLSELAPLTPVQTRFAIFEAAVPGQRAAAGAGAVAGAGIQRDCGTNTEDVQGKLKRLLEQVNHKFPERLKVGLRPSFRELRLKALAETN